MMFGATSGHSQIVISSHSVNQNADNFNFEGNGPTSGRVYESCIGTGCSRSPSPIRREFWESNKALPERVVRRKESSLREKLPAPGEKQSAVESHITIRQGRPRVRINQSRDPLFVYNNGSESVNGSDRTFNSDNRSDYHTPSPRRPHVNLEIPGNGGLTVDVDVPGENRGCRVVTVDNNCPNPSPTVRITTNTYPRTGDNDTGLLCCPSSRSKSGTPSPRAHFAPSNFVDRASSPVSIRSRSGSPPSRGTSAQGRLRTEGRGGDQEGGRVVNIDEDEDGTLHLQISTSDNHRPTVPVYLPRSGRFYGNRSESPVPDRRSPSPSSTCRSAQDHNIVEISSEDEDLEVHWEGNDVNLQVDLENSDSCSTPRRVNIRCGDSPSRLRSKSNSRSPSSLTPRHRSQSPTAARSPDPPPQYSRSASLHSRPPWDNTTLPAGKGALRLNRPPPVRYKSRSPSKSRSQSPTGDSGRLSPISPKTSRPRTPQKIESNYSSSERSSPVDGHYSENEPEDQHDTSFCNDDGWREQCFTPKSGSTRARFRSQSPSCVQIRTSSSRGPHVTIHRDYLSSEDYSKPNSEPHSVASSRSVSPHISHQRSGVATPPNNHTGVSAGDSTPRCNPTCLCVHCGPVKTCCSCCNCCSNTLVHSHSHVGRPPPRHCSSCPHFQPYSTSCYPTTNSSACCSSCQSQPVCLSLHHRMQLAQPQTARCCDQFCPLPGDIIIRAQQRQSCPHSGKDDGQVEFFSHHCGCVLKQGDSVVRLGKFDRTGRWCPFRIVGMFMLGSHGWIFLGEEEANEHLRPVQADQHQIVRTVNRWFKPRFGDLIIHTLPGPHSFYFWDSKKRLAGDDTRLLLRAFIGVPQVVDERHDLSCCTSSHLPVGYAELYVNVRNHWLFLGRDDHMFTECEVAHSSSLSVPTSS